MVIKGGWQPGNKDAEKAEEFAFSPRPEPLGADIVFFSKPFGPDTGPLLIKMGPTTRK